MKVPHKRQGSMGIPSEIHPDTIARQRAEEAEPAPGHDPAFSADAMQFPDESEEGDSVRPVDAEALAAAEATAEAAKAAHPLSILERLGVKLSDEDFHNYLFKGAIEKEIKLCYDPLTKKPFVASFRTLTAQEYDEVDELLAEEMDSLKMTGGGRDARRSVWLLAFAMTKVAGRLLVADVLKKGPNGVDLVDTKATARKRVVMTRSFSATILDKAARLYGAYTTALTLLMEDPENTYLKKP